jgi:hypothetical protein
VTNGIAVSRLTPNCITIYIIPVCFSLARSLPHLEKSQKGHDWDQAIGLHKHEAKKQKKDRRLVVSMSLRWETDQRARWEFLYHCCKSPRSKNDDSM